MHSRRLHNFYKLFQSSHDHLLYASLQAWVWCKQKAILSITRKSPAVQDFTMVIITVHIYGKGSPISTINTVLYCKWYTIRYMQYVQQFQCKDSLSFPSLYFMCQWCSEHYGSNCLGHLEIMKQSISYFIMFLEDCVKALERLRGQWGSHVIRIYLLLKAKSCNRSSRHKMFYHLLHWRCKY